ncbi:MAG: hypothetical protein ACLR2M_01235 [Varibaculum sp.]
MQSRQKNSPMGQPQEWVKGQMSHHRGVVTSPETVGLDGEVSHENSYQTAVPTPADKQDRQSITIADSLVTHIVCMSEHHAQPEAKPYALIHSQLRDGTPAVVTPHKDAHEPYAQGAQQIPTAGRMDETVSSENQT